MFMDVGVLRGSTVDQAGTHLGVEGLAQVGCSSPHAAAPAVDGPAVGGGAQEMPEQGQDFLLHHLRLARVEFCHKFWGESKKEQGEFRHANTFQNLKFRSRNTKHTRNLFNKIHLCFAV